MRKKYKLLSGMVILFMILLSCTSESSTEAEVDVTNPTVLFDNIANGATLTGIYSVIVNAFDNNEIDSVAIYIDGQKINQISIPPYVFSINCNDLDDGEHTLQSKAWDNTGNIGVSDLVAINTIGIIDFTNDDWLNEVDYYIAVEQNCIDLNSRYYVDSSFLTINDVNIPNDEWEEFEDSNWLSYSCEIDIEDIVEFIDLSFGNEISIFWNINGKVFESNLEIPYNVNADFPEFNVNNDYNFSWSLPIDPVTQIISSNFGDYTTDFEVYRNYQIESNVRNYVILENEYEYLLDKDDIWFFLSISALNYIRKDECIFFSQVGDSYYFDDYDELYHKNDSNFKIENLLNSLN